MVKESQSGVFTGTLFAGQTAEEDESYDGDNLERLRSGIVFDTGDFEVLFRSGIGSYLPLEDNHFTEENGESFYYPYPNETIAEVDNPRANTSEMEVIQESVSLRYRVVGTQVFVITQSEVTAYSPVHVVVDDELYAMESPIVAGDGTDFESDDLLGLDARSGCSPVRNVRTDVKMPVDKDEVTRLLEEEEFNGALELQDPDTRSYVRELVESLR